VSDAGFSGKPLDVGIFDNDTFGGAVMSGLDTLLLLVPSAVVVWLLLGGQLNRTSRLRAAPVAPQRRRLYQRARSVGRTRMMSGVDGRPMAYTIESAGAVVPEVVLDPGGMVPAAGHAMVESIAVAAHEQTPAYQAAAASPAAQAAAGTPLAEEVPLRMES
jgi:hypothetical protein